MVLQPDDDGRLIDGQPALRHPVPRRAKGIDKPRLAPDPFAQIVMHMAQHRHCLIGGKGE